jgi:hydrogenase/urease accessory protein HupE
MHLLSHEQNLEITVPGVTSAVAPPASTVGVDYIKHGMWHILTGWDHMLFMAALVLAAASISDLVKVVTAFTLAHTLTLTLSVLDIFRLPSSIVEPIIAASLVFVAVQNIVAPRASRGWTRLLLAFGFGLFHGLGFAGGLLEAMEGLSGVTITTAILAFSLGVELGHQCVVLPLFAALQIGRKFRVPRVPGAAPASWAVPPGSLLIACAGSYYFLAALMG